MAVLAMAAMVVFPAVISRFRDHALRQGGDAVRVSLLTTRMRAMERGEAYAWRFEPGGRWYVALPRESAGMSAGSLSGGTLSSGAAGGADAGSSGAGSSAAGTGGDRSWVSLGELPEGVTFTAAEGGGTIDLKLLEGLPGVERVRPETVWSAPCTFSVDGSSNGGEVVVTDARKQMIRLSVRALTGGVTQGELEAAPER